MEVRAEFVTFVQNFLSNIFSYYIRRTFRPYSLMYAYRWKKSVWMASYALDGVGFFVLGIS